MSIVALTSLSAFLMAVAIAIIVFRRNPYDTVNQLFLWLCSLLAYGALTEFGVRQSANFTEAAIWTSIGASWTLCIPAILHFTVVFCDLEFRKKRLMLATQYVLAFFFSGMDLVFHSFSLPIKKPWGWEVGSTPPSLLNTLFDLWCYGILAISLALLIIHYARTKERRKRDQARLSLIGFLVPVLTVLIYYGFFYSNGRSSIPDPTSLSLVIGFLVIGYGIWKFGLFNLTPRAASDTIVESMSNLLFIVTPKNVISAVNPALSRLVGYEPQELEGADANAICDKDLESLVVHAHNGAEVELRSKTGELIPVLLTVSKYRNRSGMSAGLICIGSDLTERKQVELDRLKYQENLERQVRERTGELEAEILERRRVQNILQESEERYRLLVENATDAIFVLEGGKFDFANSMTERITGYSSDTLTELQFHELICPKDRQLVLGHQEQCMTASVSVPPLSFRIVTRGGEERWTEINSVGIQWNNGTATLNFMRDITNQKNLESQLIQSQKLEAVGTLAGGIAHDFNNILQAIQGYAQVLLMDEEKNDPIVEELQAIERSAHRAGELTKQLLIFSRKVESKLVSVDINAEIKNVEQLLRSSIPRMIEIDLQLGEDLAPIYADPAQIEQILMNLGLNARDAMPDGGRIVIRTEDVSLSDDMVYSFQWRRSDRRCILLSFSDTGCGMNQEMVSHMFEPFYTTKDSGKGTGLGLAMVHGIVESHDGHISCESMPGKGTVIRIYLPVHNPHDRQKPASENETPVERGNEHILVVDDEETLRNLAIKMLTKHGYTVTTAGTGEEALVLLRQESERFDLVLLDLNLPGMGGMECLTQMVEMDPALRVIVANGYADGELSHRIVASGVQLAVVPKPYDILLMTKTIRDILDGRRCSGT